VLEVFLYLYLAAILFSNIYFLVLSTKIIGSCTAIEKGAAIGALLLIGLDGAARAAAHLPI